MRTSATSATRGLLLVLAGAVLWGTSGVVAAVLYRRTSLTPVDVAFARMAIGALALSPLVLGRVHVLRGHRGLLIGVGLGLAMFQVCYFAAVSLSGVSLATLITLGLAPVLVAAGSPVLLGEVPQPRTLVCLGVALLGLVMLVGAPAPAEGARTSLGAALAVCSAFGYAGVALGSRHARERLPVLLYAGATFVIAALGIAPLATAGGVRLPSDAVALALLLYLGLAPTALAYALFFTGLRSTTATAASVATLLEPVTATLLAVALLGERLAGVAWTGAGLLLACVIVLGMRPPGGVPASRAGADEPSRRRLPYA